MIAVVAIKSFRRFIRSERMPAMGEDRRRKMPCVPVIEPIWAAEPVSSKTSQPRPMDWNHWAKLMQILPKNR